MLNYSVCIEPVLESLDFYDRIPAAAELGFDAVEFWNPAGRDLSRIGQLASRCGVQVSICTVHNHKVHRLNTDGAVGAIRESMKKIKDMGCGKLILMAGEQEGRLDTQKNLLIENLKRLAEPAQKEGVTLCLEPLNSIYDHKGYYLDSGALAFEIVRCVNSPFVKVLYDIYHMQVMEGNILSTIRANIGWIGHFHMAGVPGRHEPSKGELNARVIAQTIDALGFGGYFGLEYWPSYDAEKSLADELAYLKG